MPCSPRRFPRRVSRRFPGGALRSPSSSAALDHEELGSRPPLDLMRQASNDESREHRGSPFVGKAPDHTGQPNVTADGTYRKSLRSWMRVARAGGQGQTSGQDCDGQGRVQPAWSGGSGHGSASRRSSASCSLPSPAATSPAAITSLMRADASRRTGSSPRPSARSKRVMRFGAGPDLPGPRRPPPSRPRCSVGRSRRARKLWCARPRSLE